jgi:hypothetical protein
MSIFFALSLIKRTIATYPVAQGNIINYLFLERLFMEKSDKNIRCKNNQAKVQTAVEEIAEILCNAIKRYIALPAAVKNG